MIRLSSRRRIFKKEHTAIDLSGHFRTRDDNRETGPLNMELC